MTKDEQVRFLVVALKRLASNDYHPWHGEDALLMRKDAQDTLEDFVASQQGDAADGIDNCAHEFKPLYCHGEIFYCAKCGATRR